MVHCLVSSSLQYFLISVLISSSLSNVLAAWFVLPKHQIIFKKQMSPVYLSGIMKLVRSYHFHKFISKLSIWSWVLRYNFLIIGSAWKMLFRNSTKARWRYDHRLTHIFKVETEMKSKSILNISHIWISAHLIVMIHVNHISG